MTSLAAICRFAQGFRPRSVAMATLTAALVVAGGSTNARAGYDVSANSSGFAVSSNLSLLGLANANVSVGALSGTAPNPYSSTLATTASTNISAGVVATETLLGGSLGILNTAVASTVDGVSTSGSASASTTINNLNLNILASSLPILPPATLVSIQAGTLTTSSSVTGTYGSLTPTGTPNITGLAISVLGVDVTALIEASAGAMVNIGSVAGLSIGIDVKTVTPNGVLTSGVTTDNIIVSFNNSTALGVALNGSLTIGQSQAFIQASPNTAVPEPSSMAMMGLGLTLAGGFRAFLRRRKRLMILA